jgi:hypothetical protein
MTQCQVTFRGLQHSPAIEQLVRDRSDWLHQFAPDITAIRSVIDVPHRHRHEHAVRVQLRVGVRDLEPVMVDREGVGDAYALVRDAFDVARRRLQDAVREQRGFVKASEGLTSHAG